MISLVLDKNDPPKATPPSGWPDYFRLLDAALEKQSQIDYGRMWLEHPMHTSARPGHSVACRFVSQDKQVPGALAYHTNSGELCELVIMVDTIMDAGGQWIHGSLSISAATSHEVLEFNHDPYCQAWWQDFARQRLVAAEVADPVQADDYPVNVAAGGSIPQEVSVSNFVGPLWGVTGAKGTYDFKTTVRAPFGMSKGGYCVVARGPAGETQIYNDYGPTTTTRVGGGYRSMRRAGY